MLKMEDNHMIESETLDIKAMEDRADKKNTELARQSFAKLDASVEKDKKEQEELNELFAKVMLSEREENEVKRAAEMEDEKAKAVAEVEVKYESQGLKSDHTKQLDEAYGSLLKNIPGIND